MMKKKMFACPSSSSSSGLSLAAVVLLLLLCLSFSVQQSSSYSLRRRFGVDYYGNGRGIAAGDWHRGGGGALDHLAFPSPSATGRQQQQQQQQQQQRLDEDDSSSSSSNPGVLFYAGPKFLQQMGRVLESSRDTPSSVAAGVAATGGAGGGGGGVSVAEEDRLRKISSLFRPTERQIQQFRENADWSIPMTSSVAKRNLCCSLDMYCVDCSDRK